MQSIVAWIRRRLGPAAFALGAALCLAGPAAAQATAADEEVERLLDWAETTFPQFFPTRAATLRDGPYRYRHYPQSGNYVGVAGVEVYVLGPVSGGPLLKVGELGDFRCQVRPADCSAPHASRVFVHSRSALLEADGRVITVAESPLVDGAQPIADSAASRLPLRGRKLLPAEGGGYVLAADGSVTLWGAGIDPVRAVSLVATMAWPEKLVDIGRLAGLAGLTADGAVIVPTAYETATGQRRVTSSLRLPLSQPVRQFGADSYLIFRDGTVARVLVALPGGQVFVTQIAGATNVRSIACGVPRCLALRTDGRVLAWGHGPLGDGSSRTSNSGNTAVLVQGLSSVRDVAVLTLSKAEATAVAMRDNGEVWIWGQRDDSGAEVTYPEHRADLGTVTDIACASHCVFRRADGTVWGWGSNPQNQLGNFAPIEFQRQPVALRGVLLP